MSTETRPEQLFDFAYIPGFDKQIDELAELVESEDWDYSHIEQERSKLVLKNYTQYTYRRLAEEGKIAVSDDEGYAAFNTGLVTQNQEAVFALFDRNQNPEGKQTWHFVKWCRRGERDLNKFSILPEMAHYFEDPSLLVFDTRKDFRPNVEHIIEDNKERFPEPYKSMDGYQLQTFLKGAIDNAIERVKRNDKTAIPQYYRGRIQILLPLCIEHLQRADLALVVENHGDFYRASTCLPLDWAYNNARQLARPDRDWLQP